MSTKYTREQIKSFSNEEVLKMTKGRAVDFHLTDGHWTQLCVGDLLGLNSGNLFFYTKTGIKIRPQDVDYIEVLG